MIQTFTLLGAFFAVAFVLLLGAPQTATADGTETLGTPSISIAAGSGVVAAGVGLQTQPDTINLNVPGTLVQALIYVEGQHHSDPGAIMDITVDGADVRLTRIGGPTFFFTEGGLPVHSSTYRADITGLVSSGANALLVGGLDFDHLNDGAGVMAIFDDGTSADIEVRDGNDLAFVGFASPLDTTVAQTFNFAAAGVDRVADLTMFFSSVANNGLRPTVIEATSGGITTTLINVLSSGDGREWDTTAMAATVPAGATSLTLQALSEDRNQIGSLPASFAWNAASFSLETVSDEIAGRMTGGGSVWIDGIRVFGNRVTRGFEIHCDLRNPNNVQVNWHGGNRFHMTELTSAVCTENPAIVQFPPSADFDTFTGEGTGLLNGAPGARIEFVFVDAGEPGNQDTASIRIYDASAVLVLEVSGFLDRGNMQAHND